MSSSRLVLWETVVAYIISLGIAAWGAGIVGGTIAAGSSAAWTIGGLAIFGIGVLSFFGLFAHANKG